MWGRAFDALFQMAAIAAKAATRNRAGATIVIDKRLFCPVRLLFQSSAQAGANAATSTTLRDLFVRSYAVKRFLAADEFLAQGLDHAWNRYFDAKVTSVCGELGVDLSREGV
jgi:hypothetical protein